jgi:hypothetical protein
MDPDDKRSPLPNWWLDGTGPLAIGVAATAVAAILLATRRGQPPPDGFGTLILISLIANVAAYDNCRDGTSANRPRIAIAAFVLALALAAVAHRLAA